MASSVFIMFALTSVAPLSLALWSNVHQTSHLEEKLMRHETKEEGEKLVLRRPQRLDGQMFCGKDQQKETMYDGLHSIYVAHADAPHAVDVQFSQTPLAKRTPSVYATVVGSLGGLNGFLTIEPKEEIIFYDINPWMVEFAQMYTEIIKVATSRSEFMRFYFGRKLDGCLSRDEICEFPTWDESIAAKVREQLPDDVKCAYDHLQQEYMKTPNPTAFSGKDSVKLHRKCEIISLFHNADETPYLDPHRVGTYTPGQDYNPNTCTFYYGNGWLQNEYTFNAIRTKLKKVPTSFIVADIAHVAKDHNHFQAGSSVVLYTSNIASFTGAEKFQQDLDTDQADGSDVTVVGTDAAQASYNLASIPKQTCPNSGVPGAGNAHPNAWHAVETQLKNSKVLEIARRVPWGFYELKDRRINLEINNFLSTSDFAKVGLTESKADITAILHVLVGEGESRENWHKSLQKAIQMAGQVLILEHNKETSDSFASWEAPKEKFLTPSETLEAVRNVGVTNLYVCFVPGEGSQARNFIVSTEGTGGSTSWFDWIER